MVACPSCSSPRLHRPPFHWSDALRALFLRTPVRCNDCGERFATFRWVEVRTTPRVRRRVVVGRLPQQAREPVPR